MCKPGHPLRFRSVHRAETEVRRAQFLVESAYWASAGACASDLMGHSSKIETTLDKWPTISRIPRHTGEGVIDNGRPEENKTRG